MPATQISIYNRSAYTLNQTYNTAFVLNKFSNYLQKWTKYKDNQYIKIYDNSLPSTPSLSQISSTLLPLNFPTNLDSRYQEQSSNSTPLQLDWNTFVVLPPLFSHHQESSRLHNWKLNRLPYRHDIHKDIQELNIQILQQNSLTLKFEITVRLNNIVQNQFPVAPPNITAQSLPSPFITTEIIYKYDRYTKKTIGYIAFYNPYLGLSYTCIF